MQLTAAIVFAAITGVTSGHMIFNDRAVWGISKGSSLENPINSAFGPNWLHHGATRDTDAFITLDPGSSPSFPITCGEAANAPETAASVCKTVADAHQGGGCAISISYPVNGVARSGQDDFTIISVNHKCPTLGPFEHAFPIPQNLPACDNCVCAWHWVPNPASSAAESYMNTFNCKVSGTTSGAVTGGGKPIYWGVPGAATPNDDNRPQYMTTFKDGAQVVTVTGGTGTVPDVTTPPAASSSSVAPVVPVEPVVPVVPEIPVTGGNNGSGDKPSAENGGWGGRGNGRGRGRGNGRGRGRGNGRGGSEEERRR